MVVLLTCKNKEEQIKNEGARVVTRFSPLGAICCHGNQSTQNLMQSVPHPNDASGEI